MGVGRSICASFAALMVDEQECVENDSARETDGTSCTAYCRRTLGIASESQEELEWMMEELIEGILPNGMEPKQESSSWTVTRAGEADGRGSVLLPFVEDFALLVYGYMRGESRQDVDERYESTFQRGPH